MDRECVFQLSLQYFFTRIYLSIIKIKKVGRVIYSQHAGRKASCSILAKTEMCCYIVLDLSNIKFYRNVFSSFSGLQAGRLTWQSEYEHFLHFYL
jgi:hypothetical protein